MEQKSDSAMLQKRILDTLAQNETQNLGKVSQEIAGKGSQLGDDKTIKSRAKRKLISQKLSLSFIDVAIKKHHQERLKSFWNTYYCQNSVITFESRLFGRYCKNRHCTLCNSIRKAEIINRYLPEMKTWKQPYFVTLTIKSCTRGRLKEMLGAVIKSFRQINAKYRKRNIRGYGIKLIGVKSIECNFNPDRKTYNPHLHLIVKNEKIADILIDEWLKKWTKKWATFQAQHRRPVKDMEKDLIETIKYGSKIFTDPAIEGKGQIKNNTIYAKALYNIFDSMKGLRIFERFGFNSGQNKQEPIGSRTISSFYEWQFSLEYHDWQNVDNELVLSAYSLAPQLKNILENKIDINSE